MSAVTARQFVEAFQAAWDSAYASKRAEIKDIYNKRRLWTELICGSAAALGPSSKPIVQCALESLTHGGKTVEYDRERHKVDAFGRVAICDPAKWYIDYVNVVMVEVENDVERSEEEFWKLLHARCPLKVLITYDYNDPDTRLRVPRSFEKMYLAAEQYLGPDPGKYVLIMGGRDRDLSDADIVWRYWTLEAGNFERFELTIRETQPVIG